MKKSSLLLKESKFKLDVSVNINDIKAIRIEKKSKVMLGTAMGLLVGGVSGTLLGGMIPHKEEIERNLYWVYGKTGGTIGLVVGAIGGGYLGYKEGKETRVKFEGMPPETIRFNLEILRSMARIKDYQ